MGQNAKKSITLGGKLIEKLLNIFPFYNAITWQIFEPEKSYLHQN